VPDFKRQRNGRVHGEVRAVGEELWKSLATTAARLARQGAAGTIPARAAEALRG
jgi:hypothetical protein